MVSVNGLSGGTIILLFLMLLPIIFVFLVDWRLAKITYELKRSNDKLSDIVEELRSL